MAETKGIFLTRHIGKTTYKVRIHLSETANETMEDKILRLIRNDGLAIDGECGTILQESIRFRARKRAALSKNGLL